MYLIVGKDFGFFDFKFGMDFDWINSVCVLYVK